MGIGSISFWQQDQNFWNQAQTQTQSSARNDALISAMGNLMVNEVKGLASIANKTALNRVNAQLKTALQSALHASTASANTSPSSNPAGSPATGTGSVPLSANTSLSELMIPPNSKFTISDGTYVTKYTSTGTDTVANLIDAINNPNVAGNAQVTATLNVKGQLVLTGKNDKVSITVGGTFAPNIGFGANNSSFQPTASSAKSSTSSSAGASSTASANGSTGSLATNTPAAVQFNSSYALQTGGTAETLLASSGLSGSLLNLLA